MKDKKSDFQKRKKRLNELKPGSVLDSLSKETIKFITSYEGTDFLGFIKPPCHEVSFRKECYLMTRYLKENE